MRAVPGRLAEEDVYPVTALMQPGRLPIPPRSCRTRAKGNRWRWKKMYATEGEVGRAALRARATPYECVNCGFWHIGTLKPPAV